ncbi:MAG TPA: nucleotidyltransferase domain-containing protein [Phycisphaerae bacterium]|nr:nucleotidyltransferase domain-containing protein [Phycisphaerae bacterium]
MTTHRQVLQQVVETLQQGNPQCAVLLAGSILRGTEDSQSDIDLFVVVPEINSFRAVLGRVVHSTDHVRVVQEQIEGIPVTMTCFDSALLRDMVRQPWRNYLFAKAGVLRDPLGIVGETQRAINEWYAAHPAVTAIWTEQEGRHAESKAALRQGRQAALEFRSWEAFANHVDSLVRSGEADS